jgi:hypothetical protein
MVTKLCLGVLLVLSLGACTNFQPSPQDRGVAFKLKTCTSDQLFEARRRLTSTEGKLKFEDSWVCVTAPLEDQKESLPPAQMDLTQSDDNSREEAQAFLNPAEEKLRTELEWDFVKKEDGRPALGIALAGGGSKAAAFGVGVLAGLADNDLLDSASYVSSVSGGSYAAYFYYTHRIFPGVPSRGHTERPSSQQMFWDCVLRRPDNLAEPSVLKAINAYGPCASQDLLPDWASAPAGTPRQENKYQALLRCEQDVFNPGICTTDVTSRDSGINSVAGAATVTLFPANFFSAILFDWGYAVSPSALTYRRGIGVGFGSTASNPRILIGAQKFNKVEIPCAPGVNDNGYARDCKREWLWVEPKALTFQELRAGLLESRKPGSTPMPFWVINAAAPKYRSELGWWTRGTADTTNSDMFEMTAVSHGSGRYGYVPAPVELHNMDVLDAVGASAAFLDSSQLKYRHPVMRGTIGGLLRFFNLDWGRDIPNYNVSDARRSVHKALPFPLYYLDSAYEKVFGTAAGSKEKTDRIRSAFIRLVDGGNAENLGVYSLLKRQVRTIVIADAAADDAGDFSDICALKSRLKAAPSTIPHHLYIPGLDGLDAHCQMYERGKEGGYDLRAWPFSYPVLMGCLRLEEQPSGTDPCRGIKDTETRLVIVKPAIHLEHIITRQFRVPTPGSTADEPIITRCLLPGGNPGEDTPLMNCDTAAFIVQSWIDHRNQCQAFPQHSTVKMTVNSSATLFGAYRELARQYLHQAKPLLRGLSSSNPVEQAKARTDFEEYAQKQGERAVTRRADACKPSLAPEWVTRYFPQR